MDDTKDRAARNWFGYGDWDAKYWFIGMEPGGDDDHASYESWERLGGESLIDCKAHHDDSNAHNHFRATRWHENGIPPIQNTWGPLIRVLLSYESKPYSDADVAVYQRDHWGRNGDKTAVLELSALHARSLDVPVERTKFRDERIVEIKRRLEIHRPKFALFYGTSYRTYYARIAGAFNREGYVWNGSTLCMLTLHPTPRFRRAAPLEYWVALGAWLRAAVAAGPGDELPSCPQPPPFERKVKRAKLAPEIVSLAHGDEVPIVRESREVGRILYDGWNVRVERRLPQGGYALLGAYERSRPHHFARKVGEINSIFDAWSELRLMNPAMVKASWRAAQFVENFAPPADAITNGCAVLEDDGSEVARIYKVLPNRAILVPVDVDAEPTGITD